MPGAVFFVYSGGGGVGVGAGGFQQRGRVLGGEAGAREEVAEGDVCGPGGLGGRNDAGGFSCVRTGLGCSRSPLRLGEGSSFWFCLWLPRRRWKRRIGDDVCV